MLKLEPPAGDPARQVRGGDGWAGHLLTAVNSGKRSIAIDLQTAAGRRVLHDLVGEYDVVSEQFRPGRRVSASTTRPSPSTARISSTAR